MSMRDRLWYRILVWGLLIVGLLLLLYISPVLIDPNNLAADDFGHFWAAGRLAITGKNPYDPSLILGLPYQVNKLPGMLNPPWTLPFVMIFGLVGYPVSRMLWLLSNIGIILFSVEWLWRIYKGPSNRHWLAGILAFTFTPVIAALQKGQFSPIILLGITGFLSAINKTNDASDQKQSRYQSLAIIGIAITFMAIKPQLLYLLLAAILLWCIENRKWPIIISTGIVGLFVTIIPMIFNRNVISEYLQNIREFPLSDWATPTIGSYLRVIFGLDKYWLQFIPLLIGCIWFIFYWYKRRKDWHWDTQTPLLLLVSVLTSPHTWTYDLVVLLPAIIYAAVRMLSHSRQWPNKTFDLVIIVAYVIVDLVNIALHTRLDDFWFGWVVPLLLLLYILAHKDQLKSAAELSE